MRPCSKHWEQLTGCRKELRDGQLRTEWLVVFNKDMEIVARSLEGLAELTKDLRGKQLRNELRRVSQTNKEKALTFAMGSGEASLIHYELREGC